MADFPYTPTPASLDKFFSQIQVIGKPGKVTLKWLESLGFKSSNDRYLPSILKSLGFIDGSGIPTSLWQSYRNKAQARTVMAQGLRQAYPSLFDTYPDAFTKDDATLRNFFSTQTNVGAKAISYMVRTFKTLVALADFNAISAAISSADKSSETASQTKVVGEVAGTPAGTPQSNTPLLPITMNIQIVIPSDATAEQYDKIFSSIRKFLTKQD